MTFTMQWVSALEKIFVDEAPHEAAYRSATALRGERFHAQLAFCYSEGLRDRFRITLDSPIAEHIRMFEVRPVPVLLTGYPWSDDYYLRREPGLFPDLLLPSDGFVTSVAGQWRSLWFEFDLPEDLAAGDYPVTVTLTHGDQPDRTQSATFTLTVLPAVLPKQTLKFTEWFHNDCLAVYYEVDVFSERHWQIVENYMKNAARYGVNMILTPIFTPPLDTEIGGERPTVQLIDVTVQNGVYTFGFDKLKRYLETAQRCGMEYFEFSHLFTQWGAGHAVKVIATVDGEEKRLFGWETDATDPAYTAFLRAVLTELKAVMTSLGLMDRCFFHLSDEPQPPHEQSYAAARNSVADVLSDCAVIDALSDYPFYEKGLIQIPIPSNSRAQEFLEKGVERRWIYYCCGDVDQVSNRMLAMPSQRNRILGMQMFRYQIEGFLHWGYNFWFNRLSQKLVNPFFCTDTEDTYPSGDAYLVYPGEHGQPLSSIHQQVFADGLQDQRALELLASLTSREEAVALLDREMQTAITFRDYPHDAAHLLATREAVNRAIAKAVAGA